MQSFEDDNTIFVESEPLSLEDSFAFFERIGREFDLFTFEQVAHLLTEIRQIKGIDILEIPIAVLIAGGIYTVHEIVIHRDDNGLDTINEQLDLQSLGEGGFSRGRGS